MSEILYLSRSDVAAVALEMSEIITLMETVFREKGEGRVEMPPKPGIHTRPGSFIHAMPAYIPSLGSAGVKWVSGYPKNSTRGLPYISGLIILNDVETGIPYAIMDCTWVTAYRTAAATALSARFLANPQSSVAGILACGLQGRTNLMALASTFPLTRAYAYDLNPEVQAAYVREMSQLLQLEVIGVDEPRQAVASSHLVVTSGPILTTPTPTIEPGWLQPGAFASAVDFDCFWKGEALAEIDLLATDDHAQFEYYRGQGYFQNTPAPYADLGELVTGRRPGRNHSGQKTLAINLGLALEDMAVAPRIYQRARERGLGILLPA